MLVFGVLVLCLSAAVTGYEHQVPFKFEVSPKTQQVAEMYLLGQRHEDVRSATAKASSNQRHYLHQQHPWGLRVQTNGKYTDEDNIDWNCAWCYQDHCGIDYIEIYFSFKTLFKVNLEATFTLSWIDIRYKPNKDFFVGGNKYVGRFFFKKMKMG